MSGIPLSVLFHRALSAAAKANDMPTMQDETQVSDHSTTLSMGSPTPGYRNLSDPPSPTFGLYSPASLRCLYSATMKVLKIFRPRTWCIFSHLMLWPKRKVA